MLAADFAHEFNVPHASVAEATAPVRLRPHHRALPPRPRVLGHSHHLRRQERCRSGPARRRDAPGGDRAEKADGVAGTPAEAADKLAQYAEAGATRIYLQILDLSDLDHLDLIRLGGALAARLSGADRARPATTPVVTCPPRCPSHLSKRFRSSSPRSHERAARS